MVAIVLAVFALLVGVVVRRASRGSRGLGAGEAAHAWQRDQRRTGDDGHGRVDHGR